MLIITESNSLFGKLRLVVVVLLLPQCSCNNNHLKKQGILEIPKQAATLIRNYIDRRLQSYLNLTTPRPDPSVPAELTDSILGHFLLGHLFATPIPAKPFNPEALLGITTSPLYETNDPSYSTTSKATTTTRRVTEKVTSEKPATLGSVVTITNTTTTTTNDPKDYYYEVRTTSYNQQQQQQLQQSSFVPVVIEGEEDDEGTTKSSSSSSQLLEVTQGSVIIPIQSTTTNSIPTTTEGEDEDEETDLEFEFFRRIKNDKHYDNKY